MKDVHILKDVDYAAKIGGGTIADIKEVDQLLPGAVAVFTNDDTLVLPGTVAGDIVSTTHFDVYVGVDNKSLTNAAKYPRATKFIPRNLAQASTKAYAAPANMVTVVGNDGVTAGASLGLPVTLVPGELASMRITRTQIATSEYPLGGRADQMHTASKSMRINYTIKTGDAVADVVAGLVAAINDHPENQGGDKWITAASVAANTGVQLTSNVYGQVFEIGTDELLRQASVIVTTPIDYGNGLGTQAAEQEEFAVSRFGDHSQYWHSKRLFDVAPQADIAETYITWNFVWQHLSNAPIASNAGDGTKNEMIVYVPDGATDLTDIRAVFNVTILSGGAV